VVNCCIDQAIVMIAVIANYLVSLTIKLFSCKSNIDRAILTSNIDKQYWQAILYANEFSNYFVISSGWFTKKVQVTYIKIIVWWLIWTKFCRFGWWCSN